MDAGQKAALEWLSDFVREVGVPTVLVFVFLGMVMGWLPSPLNDLVATNARQERILIDILERRESFIKLLRQICANTAVSDAERKECIK